MEILNDIINNTFNNFDLSFCISVNIATYLIIKIIDEINKDKKVSTWQKRLVLIFVLIVTGIVWYIDGTTIKVIANSAILAPVFWSWIMKPICRTLNIDYKDITIDNNN